MSSSTLKPAADLAKAGGFRYPNKSVEYRGAREALLAEIELRRHIERVAEQRRRLPPGGEVKKNMRSRAKTGERLSPACSATRIRSWSTITCSARSASGRARCARRY
jgi:Bacterial protein of unknown function (DUF899)